MSPSPETTVASTPLFAKMFTSCILVFSNLPPIFVAKLYLKAPFPQVTFKGFGIIEIIIFSFLQLIYLYFLFAKTM